MKLRHALAGKYPVQGNEQQFHVIEAKEYSARRTFAGRKPRLALEGPMIPPIVPAGRNSYVSTGC